MSEAVIDVQRLGNLTILYMVKDPHGRETLTAQQETWCRRALAEPDSSYPYDQLPAKTISIINNSHVVLPCLTPHPYMCTHCNEDGTFTITMDQFADIPTCPLNLGLPNPVEDTQTFFEQSFVHEMGHVAHFSLLTDDEARANAASCFWRYDATSPSTKRWGTLDDYEPDESSIFAWAGAIVEAIAEVIKVAFYGGRLIYGNRTAWHVDPGDWDRLMSYVMPAANWTYMPPIECAASITLDVPVTDLPRPPDGFFGGLPWPDWPNAKVGSPLVELLNDEWPGSAYKAGDTGYVGWTVTQPEPSAGPGRWTYGAAGPRAWVWSPDRQTLGISSAGGRVLAAGGVSVQMTDDGTLRKGGGPWTSVPEVFGMLPPTDSEAQSSGYLGSRSVRFKWTLPPGHDWGVVEVSIEGQAFSQVGQRVQGTLASDFARLLAYGEADTAGSSVLEPWGDLDIAEFRDMYHHPPHGTTRIYGKGPFDDYPSPFPYTEPFIMGSMTRGQIEWLSTGGPPDSPEAHDVDGVTPIDWWFGGGLTEFRPGPLKHSPHCEKDPAAAVHRSGPHNLPAPDPASCVLFGDLALFNPLAGSDASGIPAWAFNMDTGRWQGRGFCDVAGSFSIGGLPYGTYAVFVFGARWLGSTPPDYYPTQVDSDARGFPIKLSEKQPSDMVKLATSVPGAPDSWTEVHSGLNESLSTTREAELLDSFNQGWSYVGRPERKGDSVTILYTGILDGAVEDPGFRLVVRFFPVVMEQAPAYPWKVGEIDSQEPMGGVLHRSRRVVGGEAPAVAVHGRTTRYGTSMPHSARHDNNQGESGVVYRGRPNQLSGT